MKRDYKIFNEIKNDLNDKKARLSKDEKEDMKSRVLNKIRKEDEKNNNRNKKRVLIGAVACTLFTTLAFTNENVVAKVSEVGRSIERFFEREEDSLKEYKKDILLAKEDKGIKLIVNEAMYDVKEIIISTTVDYNNINAGLIKNKESVIPDLGKIEVYNNGKKIENTSEGGSCEYNKDGTVDVLLTAGGFKEKLDDNIEVRIGTDKMVVQYPYKDKTEVNGDWSVKFNLNTKKLHQDMNVIRLDKDLKLKHKNKEMNIKIEDLRITPLSMRLNLSGGIIGFEIYDENNKKIDFISQGGSDEEFSYKWIIDREIRKVKVVPFIINEKDGFKPEKRFEDLAFEIDIR
ncbi:MAG: DUF4179 domain-containing protein [Clostridium sp.]